MRSLKILLFILLGPVCACAQFGMPSFKEVVTTFFSKYSFDSDESYLKFYRKKEGWYVSEDNLNNPGNYFNSKLFWSKVDKDYNVLAYPSTNGDASLLKETIGKYLNLVNSTYDEYQFKRNKYYGYPGWDWDIINDVEKHSSITDTLLESRARAYSKYASGFIAEQFGDLFVNNDSDRIPIKASKKISRSRIEKFKFYQVKAIDAYAELLKINPGYGTMVGNVSIKLANEYMFTYLELQMAGDTASAIEFAAKADYPDSLLSLCKSYLTALPANSILIAIGDNDTYPLWYLQKTKNYRPDVTVLNYNLIGFRRYLSLISKDTKQRLFSTNETTYLKDNFDYSIYGNKTDENIETDVATFLSHLEKGQNPYDSSIFKYKGVAIKKYYAKTIFFKTADKKKSKPIQLGDYLYMNDYILLDIIRTSGNRKIFFTYDIDFLASLMMQQGDVYELKLNEE